MTQEERERLWEAEDILMSIYWDIRDRKESQREAKRLDTILGKIYNLKHLSEIK